MPKRPTIRCRWFGHKLDYVVRFAIPELNYAACSRCGETVTLHREETL